MYHLEHKMYDEFTSQESAMNRCDNNSPIPLTFPITFIWKCSDKYTEYVVESGVQ